MEKSTYIWRDGTLIPWDSAQLHLLSTAVQFGASVFEGIRAYETSNGPAILLLKEHLRRLYASARIYRMEIPYTPEELTQACFETMKANDFKSCYIRPMVLRGFGAMGMDGKGSPIETYLPMWRWGAYLGDESARQGIDVCVSSWTRPAPNTVACLAKAAGNYNNAALIKMDAMSKGFAEAIALGPDGLVSEGSGQNLCIVVDGAIIAPPINGTNLSGLTRAAVKTLAGSLGLDFVERAVQRELLYTADELFFTGTATEIVPIRSVDHIPVGIGKPGPVTERLRDNFLAIIHGGAPDPFGWLTPVPE